MIDDNEEKVEGGTTGEAGETTEAEQAGADQLKQDEMSGRVHGDTTSSNAGANQQGYHGRDGGISNGTENNPAANMEEIENEEETAGEPETEPTPSDESETNGAPKTL